MNGNKPSLRRALALLAVLLLALSLAALPAMAEGAYVYDMAGILDEGQRQELEARAAERHDLV